MAIHDLETVSAAVSVTPRPNGHPRRHTVSNPAFRFYDSASNSHFYTLDTAERDSIITHLAHYH
jgi:hypothetical protein